MIKNLQYLLILLISFLFLSYLSGVLPTESLKDNIIKSFNNEDLTISDDLDFNLVKGQHQYQDCLILSQALNLSASLSVNALMPPVANSKGQCLWLYKYTKDFNTDLMKPVEPYWYYNHGNKTLISFIASILPIHTIRGLLKFISTSLIFLSAILLIQIGYKNKQDKLFSLISIAFLFTFITYHGIDVLGQSLTHGLGDWVSLGFISYTLYLINKNTPQEKLRTNYLLFGALAAYMEYFIGIAPFLASSIFFINGLQSLQKKSVTLKTAFEDLAYLIFGFLSVWVFFLSLKVGIFGAEVFEKFLNALTYRINGDSYNFFDAMWHLIKYGYWITSGNRYTLACLVLSLFSMLIFSLYSAKNKIKKINFNHFNFTKYFFVSKYYWLFFFISSMIPFIWFMIFANHSYVHIWFMCRIFSWNIFYIILLFLSISTKKTHN